MFLLRLLIVLVIALCACSPVEREFDRVEPVGVANDSGFASKIVSPAAPQPSDSSQSLQESCACAPMACYGIPFFTNEVGCNLAIGNDSLGGVDIRLPAGEVLGVWQGGVQTAMWEAQPGADWYQASFAGTVSASRFIGAAPAMSVGAIAIDDKHDTYFVNPKGANVPALLPLGILSPGRVITIKVTDDGSVNVLGSYDQFHNHTDDIDGGASLAIAAGASVSLVAYGVYAPPAPYMSGWKAIGAYP